MSTGGQRVCHVHPYFNINSYPPLACHIARATRPKAHHRMQQQRGTLANLASLDLPDLN